ncbi:MAG: hypothetical protein ACLFVJ_21825, partial [Persicimonas sp.]
VRDMRPDLGPLNARVRSFLRRFTLPVSTGSGADRKMYIKLPESVFDRAPQTLKDALAPYMTADLDALKEAEPWLDDEDAWTDEHNAALDDELGPEIGDDEDWRQWEAS